MLRSLIQKVLHTDTHTCNSWIFVLCEVIEINQGLWPLSRILTISMFKIYANWFKHMYLYTFANNAHQHKHKLLLRTFFFVLSSIQCINVCRKGTFICWLHPVMRVKGVHNVINVAKALLLLFVWMMLLLLLLYNTIRYWMSKCCSNVHFFCLNEKTRCICYVWNTLQILQFSFSLSFIFHTNSICVSCTFNKLSFDDRCLREIM